MPDVFWILSGIITDVDGSSACEGATVRAMNTRTLEILEDTSQADGSYSITFLTFSNGDNVVVEARKTISAYEERIATYSLLIDTGVPGEVVNLTLNRSVRSFESIIFRTPAQEREDLIYSAQFRALRTVPAGFRSVQTTITRDGDGYITQMEEDDGVHVKLSVFTRDADNLVTGVSERIK